MTIASVALYPVNKGVGMAVTKTAVSGVYSAFLHGRFRAQLFTLTGPAC
jgi:hypothetical protein